MDRLPPFRRRLLQVASVIGKDIALPVLEAVADMAPDVLATELAALRAAGFLYEVAQPSGIAHSFKHALTHAVAYESLLRRHRRDLHARVLAAMRRLFAGREAELTEQFASHALRGEAWEEAVGHAIAAAERANARSAWQEAVAFLEDAIAALGHLPVTAETRALGIGARLKLRAVLAPLADVPRMMRYLDDALDLAASGGDAVALAQVNISRGAMLAHMGETAEAVAVGRAAWTPCSRRATAWAWPAPPSCSARRSGMPAASPRRGRCWRGISAISTVPRCSRAPSPPAPPT